jgi:hypothetical protein
LRCSPETSCCWAVARSGARRGEVKVAQPSITLSTTRRIPRTAATIVPPLRVQAERTLQHDQQGAGDTLFQDSGRPRHWSFYGGKVLELVTVYIIIATMFYFITELNQ